MTTTAVTTGTDHHPSFAISAIIAAFAITNADAGLIGTATLLTSAFVAALMLRYCTLRPCVRTSEGVAANFRRKARLK